VHGNGFIQLDLNPEGTIRLHVWDDEIPRQKVATPIHDHVFDLQSTVLLGTLIHETFEVPDWEGEDYLVYTAQQQEGTQNTILAPVSTTPVNASITQRLILGKGSIYTFPAGEFHQSDHQGTTVTIMEKRNAPLDYGRPRVLVPVGQEPDNDFHRDAHDPDMLWDIIERAVVQI
jgi:hypothetical protein